MNILIITKENNQGGLVTHIINLANTLTEKGQHVVVMGPMENGQIKRFAELQCKYIPMNFATKSIPEVVKNIKRIRIIIRKEKIEIIHSHNRITSVYAKWVCKREKIPFIWTLHLNNIPCNLFWRKMTFYGQKTIVVGTDLIPFCENKLKIPRRDIVVSYNGIYPERYYTYSKEDKLKLKRKWGIEEDDRVIVVLSRLDPVKGHKKVIDAVEKLKAVLPSISLKVLFTGTSMVKGYKKELEEEIRSKGLQKQFVFTNHVNPVDVLNISELFVLPSDNEGFSISIVEAFLMYVPVIRTKAGGYEDVKDFCYIMDDPEDLAIFIKHFLTGDIDYKSKVEGAYKFAMDNCTCSIMSEKVLSIYQKVKKEWTGEGKTREI